MTKSKKRNSDDAPQTSSVALSDKPISVSPLAESQNPAVECHPCRALPIDEFEMAIRELAYLKWESAGFPSGDGLDFWLEAEKEIKAVESEARSVPE